MNFLWDPLGFLRIFLGFFRGILRDLLWFLWDVSGFSSLFWDFNGSFGYF